MGYIRQDNDLRNTWEDAFYTKEKKDLSAEVIMNKMKEEWAYTSDMTITTGTGVTSFGIDWGGPVIKKPIEKEKYSVKWETVSEHPYTRRLKTPGGWLVKVGDSIVSENDPDHEWELEKEE